MSLFPTAVGPTRKNAECGILNAEFMSGRKAARTTTSAFRILNSDFSSRRVARVVPRVVHLRSADHELATHELLVVQLADRALGFVDAVHLDEGETLGALSRSVGHDLCAGDAADPVK